MYWEKRTITEKTLEDYADVFADVVNVLLFNGEQRVMPEDLVDTTARSQFKADDGVLHEQERDVVKRWKHGKIVIALLGLENQTKPDANMPLAGIAAMREPTIKVSCWTERRIVSIRS